MLSGREYDRLARDAEDSRCRRNAQARIEHDTQRLPAQQLDRRIAHVELRIVGDHRLDASEHGTRRGTQMLYVRSGGLAGDPLADAIRQRDPAVEAHRNLDGHARQTARHALLEPEIELAHCGFEQAGLHCDAARGELFDARAADFRIGIEGAAHDAFHTGANQRIGAGWRAPVIAMRFERHVRSRAPRPIAGRFERSHFRVRFARLRVPTLADDLFALRDHAANARIRVIGVAAQQREIDRPAHHLQVEPGAHRFLPLSWPVHSAS